MNTTALPILCVKCGLHIVGHISYVGTSCASPHHPECLGQKSYFELAQQLTAEREAREKAEQAHRDELDLCAAWMQRAESAEQRIAALIALNAEMSEAKRQAVPEDKPIMCKVCGNKNDFLYLGVDGKMISTQPEQAKCKSCGGNDEDMPCAYPSEHKHGCLRDARIALATPEERIKEGRI